MHKKILTTCMALAAFVVVGVATTSASAAPVITHPTGTVLTTATKFLGTSEGQNWHLTSSILDTNCTTATLTGTLTSNSTAGGFQGEVTAASIGGTGTSGDCTGSGSFFSGSVKVTPETGTNGLPWCIKSGVGDNFEITGGACSAAARPIRFAVDLTGLVTCTYERSTGIPGTFTTHPEDAVLSISEVEFSRVSGFGCPSVGKLDMSFTLETESTGSNHEPLYVSS